MFNVTEEIVAHISRRGRKMPGFLGYVALAT